MTSDTVDGDAEVIQLHPDDGDGDGDETAPEEAPGPVYEDSVEPGTARRLPIIPQEWQPGNIRATIGRHADIRWHQTRFHGFRLPAYLFKWAWCAVRGASRYIAALHDWANWVDGWLLESQAVAAGRVGHHQAIGAHTQGLKTRATRWRIVAVFAALGLVGLALMTAFAPPWAWLLLAAAILSVLVHHGRPEGKPVVQHAVLTPQLEKLTPDLITRALGALGLGEMNKAIRAGHEMPMWIGRDGPGWRADVDLPYGVTPDSVMDKRKELASGLRRNVGSVWPSGAGDQHAGRLVLFVSDVPMVKAQQRPWPLARHGRGDIFHPQPFGTDQRGNVVPITMIFESMLIGSIPRQGKTGAMRVVALGSSLDPTCEMHVHDLKGTGDLAATKKVAHRYACGADEETLLKCMDSIREVHGYLATRSKTIAGLPSEVCPDRKVTPELSARRSLKLHPVGLFIDEIQELFESEYAAEAEKLLLALLKRGPAMGIFVVMATQRPDAKSLPKAISANAGIRFCLRIVDDASNNMILGAGMYAAGYRATMFTIDDKGIGWLAGQATDPQVVRTFYMNASEADKICDRARALRAGEGWLTGEAAGDDDPMRRFTADVLSIFSGDPKLYVATIAERLAGQMPGVYPDITEAAVASQLRTQQVPVKKLRESGGQPRPGVERDAVMAVVSASTGG